MCTEAALRLFTGRFGFILVIPSEVQENVTEAPEKPGKCEHTINFTLTHKPETSHPTAHPVPPLPPLDMLPQFCFYLFQLIVFVLFIHFQRELVGSTETFACSVRSVFSAPAAKVSWLHHVGRLS